MGRATDPLNPDVRPDDPLIGVRHSQSPGEIEIVVVTESPEDEKAKVRSDIEQTRAQMSETLEAIQSRLSPASLKNQIQEAKETVKTEVKQQLEEAKEAVREATIGKVEHMVQSAGEKVTEVRSSLVDTIKQNPIPAALIGIGLGWLWMNRHSDSSRQRVGYGYGRPGEDLEYRYQDREYRADESDTDAMDRARSAVSGATHRVQDTASRVAHKAGDAVQQAQEKAGHVMHQAQEKAGHVMHQAKEKAGHVMHQAQGTVTSLAHQAQDRARRMGSQFQDMLIENPLAVGAAALAAGAALGLALPRTELEDKYFGEARDELLGRAEQVAHEGIEKVQRTAESFGASASQ